jgi:hypothetical protein
MSRTRTILVSFVWFVLHPTFADDAKPLTIQQLIEQLGHKQFSQREKAFQLLQSRGSSTLPELKKALQHPDEEVRSRIAKLIPIVEKLVALEPKRVTLNVDQKPLSEILHQIQKQTGYHLESKAKNDNKRYSFQMKEVTFWEATEQIRKAIGESIEFQTADEKGEMRSAESRSRFISTHGPFRVEAIKFNEDRNRNFEASSSETPSGKQDHLLTMTLGVFVESRFHLRKVLDAENVVAVDEENRVFPVATCDPEDKIKKRLAMKLVGLASDRSNRDKADVYLSRPSEQAKKIKRLTGSIPVLVLVQRKEIVVTDKLLAAQGTQFKSGNDSLQLTNVEKEKNGNLFVAIKHPDDPKEFFRWADRFKVCDPKNPQHRWKSELYPQYGASDRGVFIRFLKPDLAGESFDIQLTFEDWTIVEYNIPFEFKDLPLP